MLFKTNMIHVIHSRGQGLQLAQNDMFFWGDAFTLSHNPLSITSSFPWTAVIIHIAHNRHAKGCWPLTFVAMGNGSQAKEEKGEETHSGHLREEGRGRREGTWKKTCIKLTWSREISRQKHGQRSASTVTDTSAPASHTGVLSSLNVHLISTPLLAVNKVTRSIAQHQHDAGAILCRDQTT